MNKIVIVGSANSDMVIKSERLPAPGETVLGGDFFINPGGKGANQAVAAARLGGTVTFVSKVGNDIFGSQSLDHFKDEGIDTRFIGIDEKHPSGVAMIAVDQHGENSIIVAPGANAHLDVSDIDMAIQPLNDCSIILTQLETPLSTVIHVVRFGYQEGKKVILNPAPAARLEDDLLRMLYLITPNETEAEILTGIKVRDEASAVEAAQCLRDKGVQVVIITMGAKGAVVLADDTHLVSAPRVKAVDTTAAGDTFNGALVVH